MTNQTPLDALHSNLVTAEARLCALVDNADHSAANTRAIELLQREIAALKTEYKARKTR